MGHMLKGIGLITKDRDDDDGGGSGGGDDDEGENFFIK